MRTGALDAVVTRFIDDVTDAVIAATAHLDGVDTDDLRRAVVDEAFSLSTAMIDSDERHTTDELTALIDAFGHRMPDTALLHASPAALQGSSLVAGRRRWLDEDSQLWGLLTDADRLHGTHHAAVYYDRSLDVAHVVASLDVMTTTAELEAIARLRARLLAALRPLDETPGSTASDESKQVTPDEPARPLEELLAELDGLIGLDEVKARVNLVADFLQVQRLRAERDLPTMSTSNHLVFTGNPGTGKTTVARLLAQIYRTLGVVARGHLVETDRSGLVAGFVGQTAPLVTEMFDRADGGMLFIDEAYTLARGKESDFGREAIDQIVKLMEDRRDRVVVVVAGYPVEMDEFLSTNPGLRSRFPTVIEFPDYSTDEILAIVDSMGTSKRYQLDEAGRERFREVLEALPRTKGFGNARAGRNLFEAAVNRHASRVVRMADPSDDDLTTLTVDDVPSQVDP